MISVLTGTPLIICLSLPMNIRRQSTRSLTGTRQSSETIRLSHMNGTLSSNYRTFLVYLSDIHFFFDLSWIHHFKDATLFFSCSGMPNVVSIIPAMDHLDKHLALIATSPKYGRVIKAAVALRKKTLNRYYNSTDQSKIYQIVMSTSFNSHLLISS